MSFWHISSTDLNIRCWLSKEAQRSSISSNCVLKTAKCSLQIQKNKYILQGRYKNFPRTSDLLLTDGSGDILISKRHGDWRLATIAKGQLKESKISRWTSILVNYAATPAHMVLPFMFCFQLIFYIYFSNFRGRFAVLIR